MGLKNRIIALLTIEQKGYPAKIVKFYLKAKPAKFKNCSATCSQEWNGNTYSLALNIQKKGNNIKKVAVRKTPLIFINSSSEKEIPTKNLSKFLEFIIPEKEIKKGLQDHIEFFLKETCENFY